MLTHLPLAVLAGDQLFILFWIGYGLLLAGLALYGFLVQRPLFWWLRTGISVVGVAIAVLTYKVFEPMILGRTAELPAENRVQLPPYDCQAYHGLPVEFDGRIKPMESAAIEIIRQVSGRAKFEGKDPVAIVLSWLLLRGTGIGPNGIDWENYPFIQCDHHDLRRVIFQHPESPEQPLTDEELNGKFVSPAQLRKSSGFKALVDEAGEIRERDSEKALQLMNPLQRKAEEVAGRLNRFDTICQNNPLMQGNRRRTMDPLHLVALDRVPGGPWFSLEELQTCWKDHLEGVNAELLAAFAAAPGAAFPVSLPWPALYLESQKSWAHPAEWRRLMEDRLSQKPQLYLKPAFQEALEHFQAQIKAGQAQAGLAELADILRQRDDATIRSFEARHPGKTVIKVKELYEDELFADMLPRHDTLDPEKEIPVAELMSRLKSIDDQRNQKTIEQLQQRVRYATEGAYHPGNPRSRMLHLDYLEARFPNLYKESASWQEFPANHAYQVLSAYDASKRAYLYGDVDKFNEASRHFRATLRQVSEQFGPYPGADMVGDRLHSLVGGPAPGAPGTDLVNLEMSFNRIQPFKWAWVIMLTSVVCFLTSLAVESRVAYALGFITYFASLGFQVFGLFVRIVLAGRPPVSNMYETVIWVAFMSSVFAVVLEAIYRRKVIALAGALVSTFGLVLADQLPLVLDPKISPLVPVLRSNYWLTIHVLTEVSSYAGGALAWALGNIALVLLVFGRARPETLKTLSLYTYKAMQIAVLLLAAGTFLGGWWAADSWGRFWGWDPKEVWALIALVCYVVPLHMRFIGWVKDFGLAVSAVVCFASIVMSWYGVNFVLGAGLHSYGFGGGGPWWVFWAGLLNLEWVLVACLLYARNKQPAKWVRPTPNDLEVAAVELLD
jgi:ABC-type transport system involved in cytochrome c biogenesis permease subunit